MGRHPLCLLLLSAFVATSLAIRAVPTTNASYVIITNDALVPGSELLIDLHLLDLVRSDSKEDPKEDDRERDKEYDNEDDREHDREDDKEPDECELDLSVSSDDHLWHRSVWRIELDKTPKSFSRTLRILVSPDERSLGDKSILRIESSSCFKFSRSVEIPTWRRELMISLRTDKMEYNPGDLVKIESLVHTHELKPYLKPINLTLYKQNHILVRWTNVTAEEGILRKEYLIPLLARSSELVLSLESNDQVVNHTFNVEEPAGPYDEEYFEVEVRSPRYHTLLSSDESKSPSLEVNVIASHHSGAPLKGKVELRLSLGNTTRTGSLPPAELVAGHKEFSLKPEEIKQVLGMKSEESLVGHEIKFTVEVEEMRPLQEEISESDGEKGGEMNEDEKNPDFVVPVTRDVLVSFVDQSHVLFFSQFTPIFFKPGLTYVGQILLKQVEEWLPLSSEEREITINIKHFSPASESPREEKLTLKLKPNSLGEFSFKVPKEDRRLELEAQFEDVISGKVVKAHLEEILPFSTQNEDGHSLQILMDEKPPIIVIGETLRAKVESTFPTREVLYQVFSGSRMVLSGKLEATYPSTKHDLNLVLPRNVSHLLSSARLVVEVISPSNEVLSDSLRFVVEQRQEIPLEVLMKRQVAEMGEEVELIVKAEPFTNVYLLTTSDLPAFDPKEQELRQLVAQEKMLRYLQYLNYSQFPDIVNEFGESISTIPSLAPDSCRVHNESESLILTDGVVFADPSRQWPSPERKNGTLDNLEPSSLDTIEEFEWNLWPVNVTVGPSGEETIRVILPEEARLYTVAAFGLRRGKGLIVAEKPVQLLSTSKVLVTLRHPESAVRGEEILLEVHLFNNQDNEAKVKVTAKIGHDKLSSMEEGSMEGRDMKDEESEREVILKPNQLNVVTLPFKTSPTTQEPLEFEVEVASYGVHHKLNSSVELKYQGYEIMPSESLWLNNFDGEQVIEIDVPRNITNPIEKSERAHVKIYGYPLGPSIERVCQNYHETDILEERTKLGFVLAVNVLEHISNNSLFDNSILVDFDEEMLPVNITLEDPVGKDECIQYVRDSLQNILNSRREDGSFSFYPTHSGYIWLTSLMLDYKILLRNVVSWDKEDIAETVEWLAKQQKEDGSFAEQAGVIIPRKSTDEENNRVPLTSQVIASLIEANNSLDLPQETVKLVESVTDKSVQYIWKTTMKGDLDRDPYSLNIAAYALTLAKDDKVFEVLRRRDMLKIHEGDEEYWIAGDENEDVEESSLSIEATSYAALTSLAMGDLDSARPFVNFVLGVMKPNGVFVTTEDTHVALKALSQYFRLHSINHDLEHVNIDVNVTLSDKKQLWLKVLSPLFVGSLYFDHSNLSLSSPLRVESSGEGILLVQSIPEFNEAVPTSRPTAVDLNIEVTKKDAEHIQLKVCAVNLEKEISGFMICELPLLTGYELNLRNHDRRTMPQVLKEDDTVYVIFNEVKPSEPSCVDLSLDRLYRVGNLAPRYVKLYPGSEPGKSVFRPYGGDKVESS